MTASLQKFKYVVRVTTPLTQLVQDESMAKALDNADELMVVSNNFGNYDECITIASRLLSSLSVAAAKNNEKSYVIVSKKNPSMIEEDAASESAEQWDKFTVLRLYLADAEVLKEKSKLDCLATADIKVSNDTISVIQNYSTPTQQ